MKYYIKNIIILLATGSYLFTGMMLCMLGLIEQDMLIAATGGTVLLVLHLLTVLDRKGSNMLDNLTRTIARI